MTGKYGGLPVSLVAESRPAETQLARFAARQSDLTQSEYGFLLGRFIDRATLARASAIARQWGMHPHEVMIANGWLEAEDYYRALAERCAASFKVELCAADVAPPAMASPRQTLAQGVLKERARARSFVFAPDRLRPNALREMLARLSPYAFSLASPNAVRGAICAPSFALHAMEGLASRHPGMSARTRPALWQRLTVVTLAIAVTAAMNVAPVETIRTITLALAWLFVPLIALRLVAAYRLLATANNAPAVHARVPDHELPVYTLLVPLHREAHMLPGLITALTRLDYPAAKLDIKLVLEAADRATIAAAHALRPPGNVEIVVVPELHPRTKPKALNYALPLARGEYVVIYDAEDLPEPGQLRQALEAFRHRASQSRRGAGAAQSL
jgi:hypothetical protein